MAQHFTLARPYAKAIFASAVENNCIDAWSNILTLLAQLASEPRVIVLLQNPEISKDTWFQWVMSFLEDAAKESNIPLPHNLQNFLSLILSEKRFAILPDIDTLYHRLVAQHHHVVEIEVISRFELSEQQSKKISEALAKRFQSKISLSFSTDSQLIGGALIRAGNWVLDGTVKGKLDRLRDSLHSS